MKPRLSKKRNSGMTLFEVGVVIAVVMLMAIVLLPRLTTPNVRYGKINCVNNLKQIGLAYRIWEGDNGDVYPMGISVTNGGSMEMVATGNVVQTFLVMSNELGTSKILYCPEDKAHTITNMFAGLANSNISYFVGVDVTNEINPQMIISGDSNFENAGVPVKSGLWQFWTNDPVNWSATRHAGMGYIGLADGSVQEATTSYLRQMVQQTGLATNRLAIP
jgi:competence protein ComGC